MDVRGSRSVRGIILFGLEAFQAMYAWWCACMSNTIYMKRQYVYVYICL
jgi:hypothetical protein